jgi:[acyl-carrier-protein] S-malonyltransferase
MTAMRAAITFPGQGTQAPAMGAPWRNHPAWAVVETAEAALGEPLAPLLLDADAEALGRTRAAQLAVLLTSLIVWDAVHAEIEAHHEIVAFGGHSLGQVSALIASGVLSAADGVRFAATRAELTQRAADANPGRMAALLGATPEVAARACAAAPDAAWVANDNAPGQIVVAGTPDGLERAIAAAKDLGVKRAMSLPVGGAFHTPLMDSAFDGLAAALVGVELGTPSAPVVSNADAVAYADGEGWRTRLPDHPRQPVRWRECMETLASPPLDARAFCEVGHGAMIAGVAKRTVADVAVLGIATPDDLARIGLLGASM